MPHPTDSVHAPRDAGPGDDLALLTQAEVSQLLRVSRTYVHNETRAGHLPVIRLGRSLRYRRSDVTRYLTDRAKRGQS